MLLLLGPGFVSAGGVSYDLTLPSVAQAIHGLAAELAATLSAPHRAAALQVLALSTDAIDVDRGTVGSPGVGQGRRGATAAGAGHGRGTVGTPTPGGGRPRIPIGGLYPSESLYPSETLYPKVP